MKAYDNAYYQRWYRDPRTRVSSAEYVGRKAHLAVSAAEILLDRQIETVLDVGCGEGAWRAALRRIRPKVRYVGVESSEYVVKRFGKTRGIRQGTLGGLRKLELESPIDLIVCADVIQYVGDAELLRGLTEIRRLLGGVAYIEAFATEDGMLGDHDGWHERSEKVLRRFFRDAGLTHCGLYCWVDERALDNVNRFEKGGS